MENMEEKMQENKIIDAPTAVLFYDVEATITNMIHMGLGQSGFPIRKNEDGTLEVHFVGTQRKVIVRVTEV